MLTAGPQVIMFGGMHKPRRWGNKKRGMVGNGYLEQLKQLKYMNTRLIAITKPAIPECNNAEALIAYTARVSNPANQANAETAPRLLAYLQRNQHWSPFEMAHMVVEITTTRDIARQILRHRSFSFQEFSQRYAVVDQGALPVLREPRLQDSANRQNSTETDDSDLWNEWLALQRHAHQYTQGCYQKALRLGLAKEVARSVLPEGLTESRLYMAGTVRSFIHYCAIRTEAGTQKEHREIALQIQDILHQQFPSLAGAAA